MHKLVLKLLEEAIQESLLAEALDGVKVYPVHNYAEMAKYGRGARWFHPRDGAKYFYNYARAGYKFVLS